MNKRSMTEKEKKATYQCKLELEEMCKRFGYDVFTYSASRVMEIERGKRAIQSQIREKKKELQELSKKRRTWSKEA